MPVFRREILVVVAVMVSLALGVYTVSRPESQNIAKQAAGQGCCGAWDCGGDEYCAGANCQVENGQVKSGWGVCVVGENRVRSNEEIQQDIQHSGGTSEAASSAQQNLPTSTSPPTTTAQCTPVANTSSLCGFCGASGQGGCDQNLPNCCSFGCEPGLVFCNNTGSCLTSCSDVTQEALGPNTSNPTAAAQAEALRLQTFADAVVSGGSGAIIAECQITPGCVCNNVEEAKACLFSKVSSEDKIKIDQAASAQAAQTNQITQITAMCRQVSPGNTGCNNSQTALAILDANEQRTFEVVTSSQAYQDYLAALNFCAKNTAGCGEVEIIKQDPYGLLNDPVYKSLSQENQRVILTNTAITVARQYPQNQTIIYNQIGLSSAEKQTAVAQVSAYTAANNQAADAFLTAQNLYLACTINCQKYVGQMQALDPSLATAEFITQLDQQKAYAYIQKAATIAKTQSADRADANTPDLRTLDELLATQISQMYSAQSIEQKTYNAARGLGGDPSFYCSQIANLQLADVQCIDSPGDLPGQAATTALIGVTSSDNIKAVLASNFIQDALNKQSTLVVQNDPLLQVNPGLENQLALLAADPANPANQQLIARLAVELGVELDQDQLATNYFYRLVNTFYTDDLHACQYVNSDLLTANTTDSVQANCYAIGQKIKTLETQLDQAIADQIYIRTAAGVMTDLSRNTDWTNQNLQKLIINSRIDTPNFQTQLSDELKNNTGQDLANWSTFRDYVSTWTFQSLPPSYQQELLDGFKAGTFQPDQAMTTLQAQLEWKPENLPNIFVIGLNNFTQGAFITGNQILNQAVTQYKATNPEPPKENVITFLNPATWIASAFSSREDVLIVADLINPFGLANRTILGQITQDQALQQEAIIRYDAIRGAVIQGAKPAALAGVIVATGTVGAAALLGSAGTNLFLPVLLQYTSVGFNTYAAIGSYADTAKVCEIQNLTSLGRSYSSGCLGAGLNSVFLTLSSVVTTANGQISLQRGALINATTAVKGTNNAAELFTSFLNLNNETVALKNLSSLPPLFQKIAAVNNVVGLGNFSLQAISACRSGDWAGCISSSGMAISSLARFSMPVANLALGKLGQTQLLVPIGTGIDWLAEGSDWVDGLSSCQYGLGQCIEGLIDAISGNDFGTNRWFDYLTSLPSSRETLEQASKELANFYAGPNQLKPEVNTPEGLKELGQAQLRAVAATVNFQTSDAVNKALDTQAIDFIVPGRKNYEFGQRLLTETDPQRRLGILYVLSIENRLLNITPQDLAGIPDTQQQAILAAQAEFQTAAQASTFNETVYHQKLVDFSNQLAQGLAQNRSFFGLQTGRANSIANYAQTKADQLATKLQELQTQAEALKAAEESLPIESAEAAVFSQAARSKQQAVALAQSDQAALVTTAQTIAISTEVAVDSTGLAQYIYNYFTNPVGWIAQNLNSLAFVGQLLPQSQSVYVFESNAGKTPIIVNLIRGIIGPNNKILQAYLSQNFNPNYQADALARIAQDTGQPVDAMTAALLLDPGVNRYQDPLQLSKLQKDRSPLPIYASVASFSLDQNVYQPLLIIDLVELAKANKLGKQYGNAQIYDAAAAVREELDKLELQYSGVTFVVQRIGGDEFLIRAKGTDNITAIEGVVKQALRNRMQEERSDRIPQNPVLQITENEVTQAVTTKTIGIRYKDLSEFKTVVSPPVPKRVSGNPQYTSYQSTPLLLNELPEGKYISLRVDLFGLVKFANDKLGRETGDKVLLWSQDRVAKFLNERGITPIFDMVGADVYVIFPNPVDPQSLTRDLQDYLIALNGKDVVEYIPELARSGYLVVPIVSQATFETKATILASRALAQAVNTYSFNQAREELYRQSVIRTYSYLVELNNKTLARTTTGITRQQYVDYLRNDGFNPTLGNRGLTRLNTLLDYVYTTPEEKQVAREKLQASHIDPNPEIFISNLISLMQQTIVLTPPQATSWIEDAVEPILRITDFIDITLPSPQQLTQYVYNYITNPVGWITQNINSLEFVSQFLPQPQSQLESIQTTTTPAQQNIIPRLTFFPLPPLSPIVQSVRQAIANLAEASTTQYKTSTAIVEELKQVVQAQLDRTQEVITGGLGIFNRVRQALPTTNQIVSSVSNLASPIINNIAEVSINLYNLALPQVVANQNSSTIITRLGNKQIIYQQIIASVGGQNSQPTLSQARATTQRKVFELVVEQNVRLQLNLNTNQTIDTARALYQQLQIENGLDYITRSSESITSSGSTVIDYIGKGHPEGQDSVAVLTKSQIANSSKATTIAIVADGHGSQGRVASQTVTANFARNYLNSKQTDVTAALREAVMTTDKQVENAVGTNSGGATLTAAIQIGKQLYIAHVGDSRLYIVNSKTRATTQITQDHNWPNNSRKYGILVSRSLGDINVKKTSKGEFNANPDIYGPITLNEGDIIAIGSDSLEKLERKIRPTTIENEISSVALSSNPAQAAQQLAQRANNANVEDDISVIILRVDRLGSRVEGNTSPFFKGTTTFESNTGLPPTLTDSSGNLLPPSFDKSILGKAIKSAKFWLNPQNWKLPWQAEPQSSTPPQTSQDLNSTLYEDYQLTNDGLKTYNEFIQKLPVELVFNKNSYLKLFLGLTPVIGDSEYFGFDDLSAKQRGQFKLIIEIDQNLSLMHHGQNRYSLINLQAAAKVIQTYPDYFPPEALADPKTWLLQNPKEWFDLDYYYNKTNSDQNRIKVQRNLLLHGFPVSSIQYPDLHFFSRNRYDYVGTSPEVTALLETLNKVLTEPYPNLVKNKERWTNKLSQVGINPNEIGLALNQPAFRSSVLGKVFINSETNKQELVDLDKRYRDSIDTNTTKRQVNVEDKFWHSNIPGMTTIHNFLIETFTKNLSETYDLYPPQYIQNKVSNLSFSPITQIVDSLKFEWDRYLRFKEDSPKAGLLDQIKHFYSGTINMFFLNSPGVNFGNKSYIGAFNIPSLSAAVIGTSKLHHYFISGSTIDLIFTFQAILIYSSFPYTPFHELTHSMAEHTMNYPIYRIGNSVELLTHYFAKKTINKIQNPLVQTIFSASAWSTEFAHQVVYNADWIDDLVKQIDIRLDLHSGSAEKVLAQYYFESPGYETDFLKLLDLGFGEIGREEVIGMMQSYGLSYSKNKAIKRLFEKYPTPNKLQLNQANLDQKSQIEIPKLINNPTLISENTTISKIINSLYGQNEILTSGLEIIKQVVNDLPTIRTYTSLVEAYKSAGIEKQVKLQPGKYGMYEVVDLETGKKQGELFSNSLEQKLASTSNLLPNFSIEARMKGKIPIIVVSYDINDHYQIIFGISDYGDKEIGFGGSGASFGKLEVMYLIDKQESNLVRDLASIIPSSFESYIVGDDFDLQGTRVAGKHGSTNDNRMVFHMIISAESLATFLHETGHALVHSKLLTTNNGQQFLKMAFDHYIIYDEDNTNLAIWLIDEEVASILGKIMLEKSVTDDGLKNQVSVALGQIPQIYSQQVLPVLFLGEPQFSSTPPQTNQDEQQAADQNQNPCDAGIEWVETAYAQGGFANPCPIFSRVWWGNQTRNAAITALALSLSSSNPILAPPAVASKLADRIVHLIVVASDIPHTQQIIQTQIESLRDSSQDQLQIADEPPDPSTPTILFNTDQDQVQIENTNQSFQVTTIVLNGNYSSQIVSVPDKLRESATEGNDSTVITPAGPVNGPYRPNDIGDPQTVDLLFAGRSSDGIELGATSHSIVDRFPGFGEELNRASGGLVIRDGKIELVDKYGLLQAYVDQVPFAQAFYYLDQDNATQVLEQTWTFHLNDNQVIGNTVYNWGAYFQYQKDNKWITGYLVLDQEPASISNLVQYIASLSDGKFKVALIDGGAGTTAITKSQNQTNVIGSESIADSYRTPVVIQITPSSTPQN